MDTLIDLSEIPIFVCSTSILREDMRSFEEYIRDVAPVVSGNKIVGYVSHNCDDNRHFVDFKIYLSKDLPERLDIESGDAFLVPFMAIKNSQKICAFKIESTPFGKLGEKIFVNVFV